MKKYLFIFVFLICSSFTGTIYAFAEGISNSQDTIEGRAVASKWVEWPEKSDVSDDNVWMVNFNMPLDNKSVNTNNIFVLDSDSYKVPLKLVAGKDDLSVLVKPVNNYMEGCTYSLYIKDVISQKGLRLKYNVRMKFTISSSDMEPTEIDKIALQSKIAEVETLVETDYTEGSWEALQRVLAEARSINDRAVVLQEEVDRILATLIFVKDGLVAMPEEFLATNVIIDNHINARPQSGLNDAKLIYETSVAPGITRFMAVFDLNSTTNEIGPIRSAREHLVQLAATHKGSLVHAGGDMVSLNLIPYMPFLDFDEIYNSPDYFYRSHGRAPYNLFTNRNLLLKGLRDTGESLALPAKNYPRGKMTGGYTGNEISVNFYAQQLDVKFIWDGQHYKRYENNRPVIIDQSVMSANNVVVLYAPHRIQYLYNLNEWVVSVDLVGSGIADYYRDGKMWQGTWEKSTPQARLQLLVNRSPMLFAEGNIWILIV